MSWNHDLAVRIEEANRDASFLWTIEAIQGVTEPALYV